MAAIHRSGNDAHAEKEREHTQKQEELENRLREVWKGRAGIVQQMEAAWRATLAVKTDEQDVLEMRKDSEISELIRENVALRKEFDDLAETRINSEPSRQDFHHKER